MPSSPEVVHGIFAFGSLSAAITSLLISVRLGALEFIKQNFIDGLCADVWDGFFSSPLNLLAILFLGYLPIQCMAVRAPASMLFLTGVMAVPSVLFIVATFLELLPVILPLGALLYVLALFGLAELRLARQPSSRKPAVVVRTSIPKTSSRPSLSPSLTLAHSSSGSSSQSVSSLSHSQNLHSGPPSPLSKRKRHHS
ncbi:hypothetical protein VP01_337g4 [Puccinia sorghi]|uniref:Uncharacterized protein n=1 Tax=Puccinia sorghi TaxID=27349 RepID=A0A0L6UXN4_9BASI|nr:hypothetical protein VP01_337g4 [Puccinia sorghi]